MVRLKLRIIATRSINRSIFSHFGIVRLTSLVVPLKVISNLTTVSIDNKHFWLYLFIYSLALADLVDFVVCLIFHIQKSKHS